MPSPHPFPRAPVLLQGSGKGSEGLEQSVRVTKVHNRKQDKTEVKTAADEIASFFLAPQIVWIGRR